MNKDSKILGLDLGDRRHGLAMIQLPVRVAIPLGTLTHSRRFLADLAKLHLEHGFDLVVVGLPLTLTGGHSPQTTKATHLAQKIAHHLQLPVVFEDERFTSRQAANLLGKDQAHSIDAISAQLILEQWLERQP